MRTQLIIGSALIVSGPIFCAHSQMAPRSASPVELSTLSPNLMPMPPIDPSKPIRVSSGTLAANLTKRVEPVFPPKTNCLRVSGVVVMHAIIGKDGHVKSVEAISGADVMRRANLEAVRQWVYRPFQFHGQPVEVETTITTIIDFGGDGC